MEKIRDWGLPLTNDSDVVVHRHIKKVEQDAQNHVNVPEEASFVDLDSVETERIEEQAPHHHQRANDLVPRELLPDPGQIVSGLDQGSCRLPARTTDDALHQEQCQVVNYVDHELLTEEVVRVVFRMWDTNFKSVVRGILASRFVTF